MAPLLGVAIEHVVEEGESLVQLAEAYGFFAATVWELPENGALREKRPDMNVLLPGDVVVIPDKTQKVAACATGKRHRFRRRGIPAVFRLQLFDGDAPRAKQSYRLVADNGAEYEGITDDDGTLSVNISPRVRQAELVVGSGELRLRILFGHLHPLDTVSGVQMRLNNLGYGCGPADGTLNDATRAALRSFQRQGKLEESGEADDATRARLGELHDTVTR